MVSILVVDAESDGRLDLPREIKRRYPGADGNDGNRLWRRRAPAPGVEELGAAEFLYQAGRL
jgi:hypothetical protein